MYYILLYGALIFACVFGFIGGVIFTKTQSMPRCLTKKEVEEHLTDLEREIIKFVSYSEVVTNRLEDVIIDEDKEKIQKIFSENKDKLMQSMLIHSTDVSCILKDWRIDK